MFASSGLFSAIPCPYLPACPREAFCLYSHAPSPATDTSSSSVTATTLDKTPKRKHDKPSSPEDVIHDTPQKPAKQPRVEQRPVTKQESNSTVQGTKQPTTTASVLAKPSMGAVLMARPQVIQKTSTSSPSSNAKVTNRSLISWMQNVGTTKGSQTPVLHE